MMTSTPASSHIAAARLVAFVCFLVGALLTLQWLGTDFRFAGPPVTEPAAWPHWAASREPLDAVFAVARLGLVAAAGTILVTTLASALARALGTARTVRVIDRISPAFVRRMTDTAVGWGLLVSTVATPATAAAAPGRIQAPLRPGDVVAVSTSGDVPLLRRAAPAAGQAPDGHVGPPLRQVPVQGPAPTGDPAPEPAPGTPGADDRDTWDVRPGDHFWSIAEHTLRARRGAADRRAVTAYWRRLITANRDRLVDPANPDYLLPGQRLELPG